MKKCLAFDDVLIVPQYSTVKSRADVNIFTEVMGQTGFGIVSANMDTVTGPRLAKAMHENNAFACLHRFGSIEENINMFRESTSIPWISIGLGKAELERAEALLCVGAKQVVIDVANGASEEVVKQTKEVLSLRRSHGFYICVGNFATKRSIEDFNYHLGKTVNAYKSGIGGGSACTTRKVTGVGIPTFSSVMDCVSTGLDIIGDGGLRGSDDVAKCFALGAKAVMVGKLLAGTTESPSQLVGEGLAKQFKKYRGSASAESYQAQGKTASHRTAEGESFLIPHVGPVSDVLQQLEAGLRSSMAYVGAHNLNEFRERAEFVKISSNGLKENSPHGKTI